MGMEPKKKFQTVEEYIVSQPDRIRLTLDQIRQTIKIAVPEAEEVISYQMPAFKFNGMLIWYAVFKNHYGLFLSPTVLTTFKNKLKAYKTSRSGIHFPIGRPLPTRLITEMVRLAAQRNLERKAIKDLQKARKKLTISRSG